MKNGVEDQDSDLSCTVIAAFRKSSVAMCITGLNNETLIPQKVI